MTTIDAEADPLLEQARVGFSVLAWLPRDSRWLALQEELVRRVPLALALTPASLMHVSLQLLIPVRATGSDKEAAWATIEAEARAELAACSRLGAFTLVFEELRVLERAIILVARPDEVVRAVRERFVALLGRAGLPAAHTDIVHTTLARYRESGAFGVPSLHFDPIRVDVTSLRLVRERSYGLLEHDELARSELLSRS